MKIRIDIADEILRQAQSEAASAGCSLNDLVVDGLRLVMESPHRPRSRSSVTKTAAKHRRRLR